MGAPKSIVKADDLWKLFEAYKRDTKERFRYNYVLVRGEVVKQPLEIPLTKEGFFSFCAGKNVISTLRDYFSNRDGRYSDFVHVCTRIGDEIRQDQIEGSMLGLYNATITARLNDLADKQEVANKTIEVSVDEGPL